MFDTLIQAVGGNGYIPLLSALPLGLIRWVFGSVLFASFFSAMDAVIPAVYVECCDVTVDGIFGKFGARGVTLAVFWGNVWNRPVNKLLRTLYCPSSR